MGKTGMLQTKKNMNAEGKVNPYLVGWNELIKLTWLLGKERQTTQEVQMNANQ